MSHASKIDREIVKLKLRIKELRTKKRLFTLREERALLERAARGESSPKSEGGDEQ